MRTWTWSRAARWSIGLGVVFTWLGWAGRSSAFGVRLLVLGLLMVAVPVGLWIRRALGSSQRAAAKIDRRSRRNDGVASRWAVWRTSGRFAVRRRMKVVKPSTRQMSFFQRMRVSTLDVATPLARVGLQWIWSVIEDVVVLTRRAVAPRLVVITVRRAAASAPAPRKNLAMVHLPHPSIRWPPRREVRGGAAGGDACVACTTRASGRAPKIGS